MCNQTNCYSEIDKFLNEITDCSAIFDYLEKNSNFSSFDKLTLENARVLPTCRQQMLALLDVVGFSIQSVNWNSTPEDGGEISSGVYSCTTSETNNVVCPDSHCSSATDSCASTTSLQQKSLALLVNALRQQSCHSLASAIDPGRRISRCYMRLFSSEEVNNVGYYHLNSDKIYSKRYRGQVSVLLQVTAIKVKLSHFPELRNLSPKSESESFQEENNNSFNTGSITKVDTVSSTSSALWLQSTHSALVLSNSETNPIQIPHQKTEIDTAIELEKNIPLKKEKNKRCILSWLCSCFYQSNQKRRSHFLDDNQKSKYVLKQNKEQLNNSDDKSHPLIKNEIQKEILPTQLTAPFEFICASSPGLYILPIGFNNSFLSQITLPPPPPLISNNDRKTDPSILSDDPKLDASPGTGLAATVLADLSSLVYQQLSVNSDMREILLRFLEQSLCVLFLDSFPLYCKSKEHPDALVLILCCTESSRLVGLKNALINTSARGATQLSESLMLQLRSTDLENDSSPTSQFVPGIRALKLAFDLDAREFDMAMKELSM